MSYAFALQDLCSPPVLGLSVEPSSFRTVVSSRTSVVSRRCSSSRLRSLSLGSSVRDSAICEGGSDHRSHYSSRTGARNSKRLAFVAACRRCTRCRYPVSIGIRVRAALTFPRSASLFTIFGWISGPAAGQNHFREGGHTSIVTVVKIWLYSFGVVIIILLVCKLLHGSN